ncbi:MAG: Hsp20/alpha crystallin family protein [Deltaproteobacteria bacterium]|jgi:HSP20 family protein|nr:Hsp20/alpha crystallin family protein [Deltaproteobacteria bacterium]
MSDANAMEINAREKRPLDMGGAESTSGEPRFSPLVDIFENDQGLTVIADMPGVQADGLSIDLTGDCLTIYGKVADELKERRNLSQEFEFGDYYRQFSLSETIDQAKITAAVKDGVLTLNLPKQAPSQPRKITVVAE